MRDTIRRIGRPPSSVAMIAALVALVPWFPYPGRIVADTKLDLVADPWTYLERSQSAWDSHAFFGQLQNQAYGYLFPMGPFFGVGRSLHVSEWIVQRAWWTLVLVVAFTGFYVLCRRVTTVGPRAAAVGAVAFALSPHALTVLGPISVEQWPSAVSPWLVIVSLRMLESSGRARLHAALVLSVVAAATGGVNATVTLAALSVPALFVLTAGRRGVRMFPLWCVAVLVGTAWWAVPLVVLGSYANPFLEFIETSNITTSVTSVPNILRGASHWVAYVGNGFGAEWPAGAQLAVTTTFVLSTTVVGLIGVLGLASPRAWPGGSHTRTFAVVSVALGAVGMGLGWGANLQLPFTGAFAGGVRDLLDGSLSAFRNVHKLDVLVRMPVCLGLAVFLSRVPRLVVTAGRSRPRSALVALPVAVVLAVGVSVWPALGSDLAARSSFTAIPERWYDAARTVDALAAEQGGSTLVSPAARFGEFTWGNTQDSPMEALTTSPVVARNAIPLGNPGAIRVMDALEGVLQSGAARPGLVDLLARMGVGRVVVPHDVLQHLSDRVADPGAVGADDRVEQTLRRSGLQLVEAWGTGRQRMSVWTTGRAVARAEAYDADSLVRLTGGPEAVVALAALGRAGTSSPGYLVADDGSSLRPTRRTQTDSLRKRGIDVAAAIPDEYSTTLPPDEDPVRRDFPPAGSAPATTRGFTGLADVRASSTSAVPGQLGFRGPAAGVFAAFDGDDDTAWSSAGDDERPTIDVSLAGPARVGAVTVRLDSRAGSGAVKSVELTADGQHWTKQVTDQAKALVFPVHRAVEDVRVRLTPELMQPREAAGIATIGLEGVDAAALLDLPDDAAGGGGDVVISRDPWSTDRPAGRRDDGRVLARRFTADRPLTVDQVLVRSRTTAAVEQLLDGWRISGPRLGDFMRTRPGAALDGDPSTRWTVGYLAADPSLTVDLGGTRILTGLDGLGKGNRYTRIDAAEIEDLDTGEVRRWTADDPDFAPLEARRVRVTFDLPRQVSYPYRMPDVTLEGGGTPPARRGDSVVAIGCKEGVRVDTGAAAGSYGASVTRDDLLKGAVVAATPCAGTPPATGSGPVVVRGTSSEVLDVDAVALGSETTTSPAFDQPRDGTWTDRRREMAVDAAPRDRVVAWHEGFNAGWHATLGDRELRAVQVDGWRQAFVVPAGEQGLVTATFAPDRPYRAGLVGGGLLVVLALVIAALWRPGRSSRLAVSVTQVPRPVVVMATLAVPALLGGLGGLVIGVLATVVPGRRRWTSAAVVAVVMVLATWRWPSAQQGSLLTVVPQACGLLVLALLVASLAPSRRRSEDGALE